MNTSCAQILVLAANAITGNSKNWPDKAYKKIMQGYVVIPRRDFDCLKKKIARHKHTDKCAAKAAASAARFDSANCLADCARNHAKLMERLDEFGRKE